MQHRKRGIIFRPLSRIPQRLIGFSYLVELVRQEALDSLIRTRSLVGMDLHCQVPIGRLDIVGTCCWRNT
jgi:hypothetical protein